MENRKSWGLYHKTLRYDIASAHNMGYEEAESYFKSKYQNSMKFCEIEAR